MPDKDIVKPCERRDNPSASIGKNVGLKGKIRTSLSFPRASPFCCRLTRASNWMSSGKSLHLRLSLSRKKASSSWHLKISRLLRSLRWSMVLPCTYAARRQLHKFTDSSTMPIKPTRFVASFPTAFWLIGREFGTIKPMLLILALHVRARRRFGRSQTEASETRMLNGQGKSESGRRLAPTHTTPGTISRLPAKRRLKSSPGSTKPKFCTSLTAPHSTPLCFPTVLQSG